MESSGAKDKIVIEKPGRVGTSIHQLVQCLRPASDTSVKC